QSRRRRAAQEPPPQPRPRRRRDRPPEPRHLRLHLPAVRSRTAIRPTSLIRPGTASTSRSASDAQRGLVKVRFLAALLLPYALATTAALADDKAACLQAASKGQRMRAQHDLVGARDQFRACAAAGCPAIVQRDCATWLTEVDKALPTVVVTAKDAAGADLVNVSVSVDGQPLLTKLDGRAL